MSTEGEELDKLPEGITKKEFKFTKKPNVIKPVPNELDFKEQLRALQLKRKNKSKKASDKAKA